MPDFDVSSPVISTKCFVILIKDRNIFWGFNVDEMILMIRSNYKTFAPHKCKLVGIDFGICWHGGTIFPTITNCNFLPKRFCFEFMEDKQTSLTVQNSL